MGTDRLVYSQLKEEEPSIKGWDKQTILYVNNNVTLIKKMIVKVAQKLKKSKIATDEIEDIFSNLLIYLHDSDDYNIEKALDRSSNGTIVSIEGYISSCVKYCTIRYLTTEYSISKNKALGSTDEDGNELSALDLLSDENTQHEFDRVLSDLEKQCQYYEHARYKYGLDIFQIWYIRLLTIDDQDEAFNKVLYVLGISKRDLVEFKRKALNDTIMINIAKSVTNMQKEQALQILSRYVYSSNMLAKLILSM